MVCYCLAGQEIHFSAPIPELESFIQMNGTTDRSVTLIPDLFYKKNIISRTTGWVGGAQRSVETYAAREGMILRVEGCEGEFFIEQHGEIIAKLVSKNQPSSLEQVFDLQKSDREILIGPALILALALRDIWSLHASAVIYKETVIVFLGESGQGKSTLAKHLSQNAGWRLVADDILPIQIDSNTVSVLPHFPQLKLPVDEQPGVDFPEQLPLNYICVLARAEFDQMPELQKLSTVQAVQSMLIHIAGTRMFPPNLLTTHLDFSTEVGRQIPAYRLVYPHRRDTLSLVKELLEKICQP